MEAVDDWDEDAERLNALAKLAVEEDLAIGEDPTPPELTKDGAYAASDRPDSVSDTSDIPGATDASTSG